MASDTQGKMSRTGDVLIVVHDFAARTADELHLRRGDRIELIERDDEFGDGWFLGKHIKSGETGLFPEVYTTPANKMVPRTPIAVLANATAGYSPQIPESDFTRHNSNGSLSRQSLDDDSSTLVSSGSSQSKPSQNAFARRNQSGTTRSLSTGSITHPVTNPVMNETLSVIEEHITDMHTPRQSYLNSTYGNHDDFTPEAEPSRLSYINGHETDEEDVSQYTEKEVRTWTPSQVAEHLEQLGADRSHCEVFKEQEITGDVLLEMDKDTILLKEFELGTLGRRLTLWKKVQNFQIEVKGPKQPNQTHVRSGSLTNRSSSGGPVLPKIPSLNEPSGYSGSRQRAQSASTHEMGTVESRHSHISRPSATSIHSVPHSRRHSSMDIGSMPGTPTKKPPRDSQSSATHVKQGSFDRTWTMGSQTTAVPESQPSTASGGVGASPSADSSFLVPQSPDYIVNPTTAVDLERGYFSSNENESRRFRNVLRKRETGTHVRAPSDSHGALRLSGVFRHVRTGSTDSLQDTGRQSIIASIKRLSGGKASSLVLDDANGIDAIANSPTTIESPIDPTHSPISATKPKPTKHRVLGLRRISDAITSGEKSATKRKEEPFSPTSKEQLILPSSRTDSSNQSVTSTGQSVSIEEKKVQPAKYSPFPTVDKASKRKHKHETSAYLRGLEKKSPAEQLAGSEYSGWMKKKSRKLGKWHSRLFVLRGCRLSYYYTEDDTEEKGLIDIAYHRVLPANKDLLTGFHATLTGAGSSPVSPSNASLQTAAQIDLQSIDKNDASYNEAGIFIFKLVPPRQGMSRAVNFTEPKVHFFAVSSVQEGRKWMAALMKATIESGERKLLSSTYKEKTMSLGRARELRVRPVEFQPTVTEEGEIIEAKPTNIKVLEGDDTNNLEKSNSNTKGGVDSKEDKDDRSDGWSLVNGSVDGKATEAGLAKSALEIS